jgi:ABC-type antimicrobial peptide transport system permease subunit
VSPNYHRLTGIPLIRGRLFENQDRQAALPVALVSSEAARILWPGQEALGRRINVNPNAALPVWHTVVGIVGNVLSTSGTDIPGPDVYLSSSQAADSNVTYVVRTEAPLAGFGQAVEKAVQEVDPEQSVYDMLPMQERVETQLWQLRLSGALFVVFGVLALVLSVIGAAGVVSYTWNQRRRETGIRLALGAGAVNISVLILGQTIALAVCGALAGVIAAIALSPLLTRLVDEVKVESALSFGAIPLLLLLIVTVVSSVPVWRAIRVDPITTLREE